MHAEPGADRVLLVSCPSLGEYARARPTQHAMPTTTARGYNDVILGIDGTYRCRAKHFAQMVMFVIHVSNFSKF